MFKFPSINNQRTFRKGNDHKNNIEKAKIYGVELDNIKKLGDPISKSPKRTLIKLKKEQLHIRDKSIF